MDAAISILDMLIEKDKPLVSTKGRAKNSNRTFYSRQNPLVPIDKKIAILINKKSASASEVVSASIQDLDRGIVLGQTSFGKGLVQNYFQLPYRTQMKITTAKYYTPSGRCIQLLDYSHRQADGSVGSVPDSARKEFTTTTGRIVKDGGGVQPDIYLEPFGGLNLFTFKPNGSVLLTPVTNKTFFNIFEKSSRRLTTGNSTIRLFSFPFSIKINVGMFNMSYSFSNPAGLSLYSEILYISIRF